MSTGVVIHSLALAATFDLYALTEPEFTRIFSAFPQCIPVRHRAREGRRLDAACGGLTVIRMVAITFKVSPTEARKLRAEARAAKRTVSAHLRAVVFPQPVARRRKRIIKRHPVSGLLYDATPGPAVSLDDIKAALADFP